MRTTFKSVSLVIFGILAGLSLNPILAAMAAQETSSPLPLEQLRMFTEVYVRMKNELIYPIEDKTLIRECIHGMVTGVDPDSAYLDEEAFRDLRDGKTENDASVGLELSMDNDLLKVITSIEGGPAHRAGIMNGDLITKIDDTPVRGMRLDEGVKRLRGDADTQVTLEIVRKGKVGLIPITLQREVVKVQDIKAHILESGLGYVHISKFLAKTADNLATAIEKLQQENGGALKGVVLDLRNNPGGLLNAAIAVSDMFLEGGLIVFTESRVKDMQMRSNASADDILHGAPLVVLVNDGSAAASEIVAGALQDHKRATIMGKPTYGRASIQTILPLTNEVALKLTTARWYTPNGDNIQSKGISPDIISPEKQIESGNDVQLTQAITLLKAKKN